MRIIMGNEEGRNFRIVVPLRLITTRLGAAIASGVVNRRLGSGEPDDPPAEHALSREITPRQMRELGYAIRKSAQVLQTAGLPLLEMRNQDGEWVRIEL